MKHATSRRLLCRNLCTLAIVTVTASLFGCVPQEEPEEPKPIIIFDDEPDEITPPVCGDGVVEGEEVCDDGVNDGAAGRCLEDCSGESTSTCGNGVLDQGEHCDGTQGMVACAALGFDGGGTSQCNASCQLDVSTCSGVRRLPSVTGSPRGVSSDNRYAIYEDIQLECRDDGGGCYADPGEPGVIYTLDLVGGEVISHGEELATISMTPIDAERFWILAEWNRDEHFGQLQIRRFDGTGEPVVVADDVSIELFDGSHPTHLAYTDKDGTAWIVPHGQTTPEKVFVPERWITSFELGPDGRTALIEDDETVSWLNLDGGRIDFDGTISSTSPDGRWAVIRSWSLTEHHIVSMADGSKKLSTSRRLEDAEFSPSSTYVYLREEACTYWSRTRVISLPDGEETAFGTCARYQPSAVPSFTEDSRWLRQQRWIDGESRHELLFTDMDSRETTTVPYRLVSEDQQLPTYLYDPSSEQLVFSGEHTDETGDLLHRLNLSTGEFLSLPSGATGGQVHDGGWLIAVPTPNTESWTWDRYLLAADGSSELIARAIDWIEAVPMVPGLFVVRPADTRALFYARRGQASLEPLSEEDGWNVRTYGPYLVWEDYNGTWLTIPE